MSSTTLTLTLPEAKSRIRTILESTPDQINPHHGGICMYTADDNPDHHCVVGQLLVELGVPNKHLDVEGSATEVLLGFAENEILNTSPEVREFLNEVQLVADGGKNHPTYQPIPWGKALEVAVERGVL